MFSQVVWMVHGVTGLASVPAAPPTRTHVGQNPAQEPAPNLLLHIKAIHV